MCSRICLDVIRTRREDDGSQNVLTVVETVVLGYDSTLCTVIAHEPTGQRWVGLLVGLFLLFFFVLCCVIVSIFSPFFWLTNVIETQSAVRSVGRVFLLSIISLNPVMLIRKKRMLSHWMILVFRIPSTVVVLENSHDLIAKNSAPVMSVLSAVVRGDDLSARIVRQTMRGRHA